MTRKEIFAAAFAFIVIGACVVARGVYSNDNVPVPTYTPPDASDERQWTKQEFDAYAFGKTKAQIRADLGSPDAVNPGDEWYYGNLKIYDRDAGTQAPVDLQFEGLDDDSDSVAEVIYP